jgi:AcrR family transcriptional regulator
MMHTDGSDVKRDPLRIAGSERRASVGRRATTSSGTVNRKAEQGRETRALLLSVGREEFGTVGFHGTSLDHIAAAAGVTKGALYHHFSGKDDLFRAVYEQVKRDVTEQVAPSFLSRGPWESLVAGCRAMVEAYLQPEVRRITLLDGRAVLGWASVREIDARFGAILLRGALRQAMVGGVISRLPLVPLAQMLNGAITEGCLLVADADDPAPLLDDVHEIVGRILEGLRVNPRS